MVAGDLLLNLSTWNDRGDKHEMHTWRMFLPNRRWTAILFQRMRVRQSRRGRDRMSLRSPGMRRVEVIASGQHL